MAEREFLGTERFEVRRRLGQGGMGVVYEAFDHQRASTVALKTLNRFDAQAIYRMKQEFRALSDVSHPNLAQLHELVSVGPSWFITMELVDGTDFLTWVRGAAPDEAVTVEHLALPVSGAQTDTRLPDTYVRPKVEAESFVSSGGGFEFDTVDGLRAGDALGDEDDTVTMLPEEAPKHEGGAAGLSATGLARVRDGLRQLAEGMIALHDSGKLHRDIKPSNVMVTHAGRVVVLDFGLVTEMYEEWLIKSTLEGVVCGTVAYMAPEQSAGQTLGPASDWYSVGVMLFEALTGRLPFEGRLFDILLDKQRFDAPEPRSLVPGVPEDLNRLCVDLLRRRPEERPTGREVLQRLGSPATEVIGPITARLSLPQLIGRERQLAVLDEAFRATEKGAPVIVHVHGRSGIGKSALVRHFLDRLSSSERVVVLVGRCYEREIVPYKALDSVIDALSRYLRKLPEEEALELMGPDVRALGRIFPVLSRVEAMRHVPATSLHVPDPLELRRRAFAALRAMFEGIGRNKRLVVYIDDLQWGDTDSAVLLGDLLRPPHPPPFLLVTSFRSEDRETSPLVRALRGQPGSSFAGVDTRELHLGPLEREEATRLAEHLLTERERAREASSGGLRRPSRSGAEARAHAEAIALESAGNPLFVYELASFADAESRPSSPSDEASTRPEAPMGVRAGGSLEVSQPTDIKLERALKARFQSLFPEARRLLEIIAVAGRPIDLVIANRAAGLPGDDRTASAVLKTSRLVRSRHAGAVEQVEAYHNRINEAVLKDRSPDGLKSLHLAIARELERLRDLEPKPEVRPLGDDLDGARERSRELEAEALVMHLAAAGELLRAGEHAMRAAARAAEALAFERAAALYQQAIQLAPSSEAGDWRVRTRLAEALVNAGRGHEAAEVFLTAAKLAPKSAALELKRRAAEQLLQTGHVDRGLVVMADVLAAVGLPYPETAEEAVRLLTIERVKLATLGLEVREKPASERSPEDLTTIDVCWSAVTGLAMVHTIRSAFYHSRLLRLALRAGEPYRMVRALAAEVCLVGGVDRRSDRTARAMEAMEQLATEVDEPHAHGLVALATGFTAFFRGQWLDAIVNAERAMAILTDRCVGVSWELDTARIVLFSSLAYRGELGELPERVFSELRQAELRKNLYASTILRTSHNVSKLWLALDRVGEARQELAMAMERWSHADFHLQHFYALLSETDFDLYEGDGVRAWSRISRRWRDVWESQLCRIRLLRVEARFSRARAALSAAVSGHEPEKLVRAALEDVGDIEHLGMAWALPIAELLRAEIAVLGGERARAIELYGAAARGFEASGMGLHRAVAVHRRGALAGGVEGAKAVADAERWMRVRGVRVPEQMIATFSPVLARGR